VSATIQDIIRRHKGNAKLRKEKFDWRNFPKEASIQLNDTHPALAIVELLRILIDDEDLDHETAWQIIYDTFSYTNHTVLPEALEKWGVDLLDRLLPRHLELIYLINHYWLGKVSKRFPEDWEKLNILSLV
jgi:starch phosphorylase